MISPHKIKFRSKFNTDFDLICGASFDSDDGDTESFLNKETISSNVYDGSRRNVHGYRYTEVMNVQFTLIKKDYQDVTQEENRKILAWLTGSNKVEEMLIYHDDSEAISYRLFGNVLSIEQHKLANGRIIGYLVSFESTSPYAFSPVKSLTKIITTPESFIINCQTDVYEKFLYPKITVTIGNSLYLPVTEDPVVETYNMLDNTVYEYEGNYYVKIDGQKQAVSGIFATDISEQTPDASTYNNYYLCSVDSYIYKGAIDENSAYGWQKMIKVGAGFEIRNTYFEDGKDISVVSSVTDCRENEIITINGDNKIISSSQTPLRIIGNSFNWDWLYFVPKENNIKVSGNCTITFEWVEPIKIGNL